MGWGMPGMPGMATSDQHFIERMIPHHEAAIAMADLALARSRRSEIRALAQRISSSQRQENAEMRQWYQQWFGGAVPSVGCAGAMAMPGMGTSLAALRSAPDFDRAFLEAMIAHHRMGVMMASHAQRGSVHPQLRQLEAAMVRVQSEEIRLLEQWYREWGQR